MERYVKTESGEFVQVVEKDAGTTNPTAVYAFGSGGLFNTPGLNPAVINATMLPVLGLQAAIPIVSTDFMQPVVPIFTGVTDVTGSNPSSPCAPGPIAGLMKLCNVTTQFGRVTMNTPTVDLTKIGQRTNRGYFTDFKLIGDPFNPSNSLGGAVSDPSFPSGSMADAVINEVAKQNLQFRISWIRRFAKLLYAGNPTNNQGDGYKEFRGLDILINTGYQDAETGIWCPAANSLLQNFGSQNISSSATAGTNLVAVMSDMFRALNSIASRVGLDPVTWAFVMPRDLFYEVTKVWPIAYATTGVTVISAGQTNTMLQVGGLEMQAFRDQMRNGEFLPVNGVHVKVILDDAIATTGTTTLTSNVYIVPLRVLGTTPATYMEFFNFDGDGAFAEAAKVFGITGKYFTTDAGRFAFVRLNDSFCVSYQGVEVSRLRLDFPHIAARLLNVSWTPPIITRSAFPGDATFYDGGKTATVSAPSFYSPNVYG